MTQNLTILFDLDGTIVNTAPDLMSAHNHVMRKFGFEEKKMEDIKSLAGKGAWVMMQRSFKEEIKDEKIKKEMTKEFIDYYAKNINQYSQPLKGSIDFFNWAKNKNISMGVCTNKQEKLAIDLLKKLNMYKYFEYVAGCDTFSFNKPDPRHLTDVVEIIGGDLKKTIMVGDSEVDANSAHNANLPFVLVKDGYTEKSEKEIKHDCASHVIHKEHGEGTCIPGMHTLEEDENGYDRVGLRLRLAAEVPSAVLDDHTRWREPLVKAAYRIWFLGWLSIGLVIFIVISMMSLVTRAALSSNKKVIEVLRLVGATDQYIAAAFVRKFAFRAFFGSLLGAFGASMTLFLLPSEADQTVILAGLRLEGFEWSWLIVVPLSFFVFTFLTARIASLSILRSLT